MKKFITTTEINELFGTNIVCKRITGASIDTRSLRKGNIFFAIKGLNTDGHKYLVEAEKKGASIAFVHKKVRGIKIPQINVKDTSKALLKLATKYRAQLKTQIVGITGSIGKTGTKDAINYLLRNEKDIFCSRKSFNNQYGLPLELLNMPRHTKYGFFEIGMNHSGEIKKLVKVLQPQTAIILNVENVHLGNFKSLKEIALAKSEIFTSTKSIENLIINRNSNFYKLLYALFKKSKISTCLDIGKVKSSKVYLKKETNFANNIKYQVLLPDASKLDFTLRKNQKNLIFNALAIITCFYMLGLNLKLINQFKNVPFTEGRGEILKSKYRGNKLELHDHSYNASPVSMRDTIDIFNKFKNKHLVYVIGDMNELGNKSKKFHMDLIKYLILIKANKVIFVGSKLYSLRKRYKRLQFEYYENIDSVISNAEKIFNRNSKVFLKGSNSINLRKLSNHLIS